MLPSSTVENYLKAIYLNQLAAAGELVPMGQVAAALGVAPGTATTMVRALNESGLVVYEPYSGVRLSAAGEKLAALVLRRHRLIELFLVEIMGMSWAEVHDEAEKLEHVVSERLIERIDEMLGHPQVDPHGDPIPGPEGTLRQQEFDSLLTCPMGTTVTVSRVVDQDPAFLRFIESHHLKPGQVIEVEARDAVADSVSVRSLEGERVTIGARAASKLMVRVAVVLLSLVGFTRSAGAQAPRAEPFAITDNSFLVEEAFNQEPGIFQNIFSFIRGDDSWDFSFTQEWPAPAMRHQFSYTVPASGFSGTRGVGDVLLNYRFQAMEEGTGRPAFAPRVSLILPTGREEDGRGDGVVGLQVNLPFSKQVNEVYFHWNAGFTHLPGVEGSLGTPTLLPVGDVTLTTPHIAGSAIYRARPMLNLMAETVVEFAEMLVAPGTTGRVTRWTISPGARGGWNLGDHQVIVGFAVPFTREAGDTSAAALFYFSYELPFRR